MRLEAQGRGQAMNCCVSHIGDSVLYPRKNGNLVTDFQGKGGHGER